MERQYKPPEIKSAKAIFSKLLTNCKPQPFIFFSLKGEFREKFPFSSHMCTHTHTIYRCMKHELGHQSYIALSYSQRKSRELVLPLSRGRIVHQCQRAGGVQFQVPLAPVYIPTCAICSTVESGPLVCTVMLRLQAGPARSVPSRREKSRNSTKP